jgi:hypothetical protein
MEPKIDSSTPCPTIPERLTEVAVLNNGEGTFIAFQSLKERKLIVGLQMATTI